MKRLALVLSMVCGIVAYSPAAHAATARPSLPSTAQFLHPAGHTLRAARRLLPLSVSRQATGCTGAVTTATKLRLNPNPYMGVGAGWTMTKDQPMTAADADVNTIQGLYVHSLFITYNQLGAAGLYYEESAAPLDDGGFYYLTYLASCYSDVSNATAAFDDAATTLPGDFGVAAESCPVPNGVPSPHQCISLTWTPAAPAGPLVDNAGNIYRITMRILQIGNALFEYGYLLPVPVFNANQSTGESNLNLQTNGIGALFQASPTPTSTPPTVPPTSTPTPPPTATPTPTQAPVTYEVLARWEKPSNKPDYTKHLASAKHGAKVDVIAFINVDSAPAAEPVTVKLAVKAGSKTYLSKTDKLKLDNSDPTGLYYDGYHWKLPGKKGTYKLTISVAMGGKSATSSATIKAT